MREKIIAILVIMLVLVIPVYSASVYAGLSNLVVKGTDDVNGYIQRDDFAEFIVTASIAGDDVISSNQVRLKDVRAFDSCAAGVAGYDCSLRIPETGTKTFTPASIPFTVELYDDASILVDSLSGGVAVDNNAPVITLFSITPKTTNTGIVSFEYSVEDYAYSFGDTSKCSGISQIEFYENDLTGALLATETINTADCSVIGTKDYTASGSGNIQICAKAYDMFMQDSSVACDEFLVDNEGPVIDANSLIINDNAGNEISYFSDNIINAIMKVDILGDDLDKNSVSADLSELNPSQASYQSIAGACGATSDSVTRCVWNFDLNPGSGGAKSIIVKAYDNYGNEGTQTFSKTFTYDNVGPVITALRTTRSDDSGNYYVGAAGNTFIADITEDAGVNKADMLLHVGNSVYSASDCSAGWTCYWDNVNVNQQSGTITAYIGTDSKDILGNYVAAETSIDVIVDTTLPVVNAEGITIRAIGGAIPAYQGYTKTGDRLEIIARVSDLELVEAYADLSAVIADAEHVNADECNKADDIITCKWISAYIDISGYIHDQLTFYFVDMAGNTKTITKEITVYGLIDEKNPSYWKNTVSCMPKLVDRQVASLMSQRVYCHIKLDPLTTTGDPETMSISYPNNCMDTYGGNSMAFIEDISLMNDVVGSRDPYLKLTIKKMPLQIDRLDFSCNLQIRTRVGNEITQNNEIENVSFTIPFYNMPLGELSASTQEKVDDAKDSWLVNAKIIGNLNKIFNTASSICHGIQTVNNFGAFWKSIGLIFDGVVKELLASAAVEASTVVGLPVAAVQTATAEGIDISARIPSQSLAEIIDEATRVSWVKSGNVMCKAVSCRLFYDQVGDWVPDKIEKIGDWQRSWLDRFDKIATLGPAERGMAYYAGKAKMNEGGFEDHLTAHLNPRESIVLSGLTLCVPGIIYNLEKYRQIECMYVDCLQNYAAQGLPLKTCEEQKSYGTCKYVVGEFFQLSPFALLDNFVGLIKRALSSPLGIIDIGIGVTCAAQIGIPNNGVLANICLVNNIFSLGMDVYEDIDSIKNNEWKIQNDYCKRMNEPVTEQENEQE